MKKALLIGGTGTISLSVTRRLISEGWDVTLLHRGTSAAVKGAREILGNIEDERDMEEKLRGASFDTVAQFIAYKPSQIERDIRLFDGKTGQYIFISTASAYQKPIPVLPIAESTALKNPYCQYSRDKAACEAILFERFKTSGFPVTIVRPSHTYDERKVPVGVHGDKGAWPVLKRMMEGKRILIHGDGSNLWAITHSRDFAKGFVGLMGHAKAIGQAVHITSDQLVCWNDIYYAISGALGVDMQPVYVPSDLLAAAGKGDGYDFEGSLLGDKAVSVVFDNSRIKSLVPTFSADISVEEGIRESVQYARTHTEAQMSDPVFEAFCERVIRAMDIARDSLTNKQ